MEFIFYLSILYILLCATLLITTLFVNLKINKKQFYMISIFLVLSLGIIAYCTEPGVADDLYRHYQELERMRSGGIEYFKNYSVYKNNYIINALFFIVSKTQQNRLLPFISILIMYSIFFYITANIMIKYDIKIKLVALFIMLHFSISSLRISISSIRNFIAFAILFMAIYREFIINKKNLFTYILYGVSCMIHSSSIIIVLCRVFMIEKLHLYKFRYILLFWYAFQNIIATTLISMNFGFFKEIGYKLSTYSQYFAIDKRLYFVILAFIIYIYIIVKKSININKYNDKYKLCKYFEFLEIILVFALGSIMIPELMWRISLFLSLLILPVIFIMFEQFNKKLKPINLLILITLIGGLGSYYFVDALVAWKFNV